MPSMPSGARVGIRRSEIKEDLQGRGAPATEGLPGWGGRRRGRPTRGLAVRMGELQPSQVGVRQDADAPADQVVGGLRSARDCGRGVVAPHRANQRGAGRGFASRRATGAGVAVVLHIARAGVARLRGVRGAAGGIECRHRVRAKERAQGQER